MRLLLSLLLLLLVVVVVSNPSDATLTCARFSTIFIPQLLAFSVAMYITYQPSESPVPMEFATVGRTMMTMFKLMLGLSDVNVLYEAPDQWLAILLFLLYVLLTYSLMLNSLIALMSNTCSIISQNSVRRVRARKLEREGGGREGERERERERESGEGGREGGDGERERERVGRGRERGGREREGGRERGRRGRERERGREGERERERERERENHIDPSLLSHTPNHYLCRPPTPPPPPPTPLSRIPV